VKSWHSARTNDDWAIGSGCAVAAVSNIHGGEISATYEIGFGDAEPPFPSDSIGTEVLVGQARSSEGGSYQFTHLG
jgi:hypothetical protein